MPESPLARCRTTDQLAAVLGVGLGEFAAVVNRVESYCMAIRITGKRPPHKERTVLVAGKPLRELQDRLYRRILLPTIDRSAFSHGGVKGRSIVTNARPHAGRPFLLTADIADFYPSIHYSRVLRLFRDLGGSEDVARVCTRLCTYRYRLPQGFVTSPILADRLVRPLDDRIGKLCAKLRLVYTRFVDDLTISGHFNLATGSIPKLVDRIVAATGFHFRPEKEIKVGRAADGMIVTGLSLKNGRLNAASQYHLETMRIIDDHAALAAGLLFTGPYFTECQVRGRVDFIGWVNRRSKAPLLPRLRAVDWTKAAMEAVRFGILTSR